ncbi:MAE_28990/MAE_18760 family HEPN-like nuclease [Aquabacterium sp. NJ1]|uniref:MAE_28990/MAE_18760 family HEPN-like nuclease n=1 Tax=Aquabacterium sp. NJ1 TaxID=1538295 RepID=UPI001269925F|nr:MAE_28990/MAE_18760 family HEPN-like nuclease [Aquabacterium sp. NJ1]
MKLRSLSEFSEALASLISWRKHELKNLQSFFRDQKAPLVPLVKSSLLLTYAHWEGGIKDMAETYLRYVERQRHLRKDLHVSFLALASLSAIRSCSGSKQLLPYVQTVDYIIHHHDDRYRLPNIQLIDTESNLSSSVLRNILLCIGQPEAWEDFEDKQRTIDTALLATRNSIAHTGRTDREDVPIEELLQDVLDLLERFKTLLENSAATKKYLHQATSDA